MNQDEVNREWAVLTENGTNDATVRDIELLFAELATKLRNRYATSLRARALLDVARDLATDEAKARLVAKWREYRERRAVPRDLSDR